MNLKFIKGNNEIRERYVMSTLAEEDRDCVLDESDGRVTRLGIRVYIQAG